MPATQKKSKRTRLQLLAEQMTQLQQEIRKQKKPHRGTDSLPKPKCLIPKPPGTAGKRNGYSVQHAMGLGTDKRQYNALMASTRHLCRMYLDLEKTCRGQDDNEIAIVVMKVQKKHPILLKFANAWPVRAWIQQYLRNHNNDRKNRLGDVTVSHDHDSKEEDEDEGKQDEDEDKSKQDEDKDEGEQDEDKDEGEQDEDEHELEDHEDEDKDHEDADKDHEDEDKDHEDEDHEDKDYEDKDKDHEDEDHEDEDHEDEDHEDEDHEDEDHEDKDHEDKDENKDENENKDEGQDEDEDGDDTLTNNGIQHEGAANEEDSNLEFEGHKQLEIGPADKHVPPHLLNLSKKRKSTEPIQPPLLKKQATVPAADKDFPTVCPSDGCNDIVPLHPSGMVLAKYKAYQCCLRMPGGESTHQTLKLEMELCVAIQSNLQRKRHIQTSYDNRWLSHINYFAVYHSALKLEPDLRRLIFDKATKEDCFVYQTLLTDLLEQGYGVELNKRLAFLARLKIFDVGHPISTRHGLDTMVRKAVQSFVQLSAGYSTPRNRIPTDAFAPLSYEQYTYFVLIPYMASRLIADDQGFTDNQQCTLQHAFEIMVASADAGDALQGIDKEGKDEQFGDVLMKIMLNQVTELDYVPVAQVSQPTAVAPQQQKGRKRKGTVIADSACRQSTPLASSHH
ncbi:hypothetical protein BDR03DRAFT_1008600 [Suillus americanus]|nr:hypothetical protein BDR03DRAFT_1008600 [Suillus americanus]